MRKILKNPVDPVYYRRGNLNNEDSDAMCAFRFE
jgi:hypothetical protein